MLLQCALPLPSPLPGPWPTCSAMVPASGWAPVQVRVCRGPQQCPCQGCAPLYAAVRLLPAFAERAAFGLCAALSSTAVSRTLACSRLCVPLVQAHAERGPGHPACDTRWWYAPDPMRRPCSLRPSTSRRAPFGAMGGLGLAPCPAARPTSGLVGAGGLQLPCSLRTDLGQHARGQALVTAPMLRPRSRTARPCRASDLVGVRGGGGRRCRTVGGFAATCRSA